MPLSDDVKHTIAQALSQAAVTGGATAMVSGTLETLVAALGGAASSFAGVFIDKVAARDTKRANELFADLVLADEDPTSLLIMLAEGLHDGEEDMLIKLRAVMRADLEAASPDALGPIARVGHQYLRGRTPAWVARGWLRLFAECSAAEVALLREISTAAYLSLEAGAEVERQLRVPGPMGVVLLLLRSDGTIGARMGPRKVSLQVWPQWRNFGLRSGRDDASIPDVISPSAPRVFELLRQHGVASDRADLVTEAQRPGRAEEMLPAIHLADESVRALIAAFRDPTGGATSA